MSLPNPIIAVLAYFEPLFTAPTWKKVVTLLVGTLLARGRRTVTAALRQMGQQMDPHFSGFHQVLNRARWSPLAVSRRLNQVLVSTFVQAGGTVEIVMDETLERRWGRKISKRGHWRDSLRSSKERSVSTSGLRWVSMAVVVTLPWTRVTVGPPFLECVGYHSQGQRGAQETTQDVGSSCTANGESRPSMASHCPDQSDWGWGVQCHRTGLDMRQTAGKPHCPSVLECSFVCSSSCA